MGCAEGRSPFAVSLGVPPETRRGRVGGKKAPAANDVNKANKSSGGSQTQINEQVDTNLQGLLTEFVGICMIQYDT